MQGLLLFCQKALASLRPSLTCATIRPDLLLQRNRLPLCHVSPYSPPPLMLATARTPPICLTKMSLDTLRNGDDSLIFQQLPSMHFSLYLRATMYPKNSRRNCIQIEIETPPSISVQQCILRTLQEEPHPNRGQYFYYLTEVKDMQPLITVYLQSSRTFINSTFHFPTL